MCTAAPVESFNVIHWHTRIRRWLWLRRVCGVFAALATGSPSNGGRVVGADSPINVASLTREVRNRFGHVECGIFATHIVGALLAFGDHAGDGGFEARGHVGFLEPVEHQLGR